MGIRMRDLLDDAVSSLRYEPTAKRLRLYVDGELVGDTVDGLLVWEPRRLVPTYAIPVADFVATLTSAGRVREIADLPVLVPTNPFAAHSTTGEMFDVTVGGRRRELAAFKPDDPDLTGYVTVDFSAFEWREEDEPIVSHPHDPFKRIDILASKRHVRIESDGRLLAESSRPLLLFETGLPTRFYLRPTDVVVDLERTDTVSDCAYKGRASYFAVPDGPSDIAWTYRHPLREAEPVRDHIAFFNERVDITVDGQRLERPITPFS
ncbi:DUF427 domain-containing protein [Mycobacterium paraterrae]|uniref:DUF427 domain-containing protein n=1 Tax=Mycobacterium paraterrae TaxID=577492 RepID=A0ABY3VQ80_9MYCO|nr:DUF427 domain-containing protein [Mycobacterium paraterrae]UMB69331.1 DUF427 domain-containing protein [Mycobacterium paraterrae]